jgi:hypothetical protein
MLYNWLLTALGLVNTMKSIVSNIIENVIES